MCRPLGGQWSVELGLETRSQYIGSMTTGVAMSITSPEGHTNSYEVNRQPKEVAGRGCSYGICDPAVTRRRWNESKDRRF